MDHIWNNLKEWESIWEEQLEREKNGEAHEYKQHNIELLTGLNSKLRKVNDEYYRRAVAMALKKGILLVMSKY